MIDPEREHLLRQIHDLERSRGRWRLTALLAAIILGLPLAFGGAGWLFLMRELQQQRTRTQVERDRLEQLYQVQRRAIVRQGELSDRLDEVLSKVRTDAPPTATPPE
jgi:Tfp pilus assembly protein PilO